MSFRRSLLVALVVGALCSCGVQSSGQSDETQRERGAAGEAASAGEATAPEGSSSEETTGRSTPPARDAESDPEPVEGPASTNTAGAEAAAAARAGVGER